jgi:hypothetical protein
VARLAATEEVVLGDGTIEEVSQGLGTAGWTPPTWSPKPWACRPSRPDRESRRPSSWPRDCPPGADRAEVLATTGVDDPETVVTEPFSEWVLAGELPAGRPAWDVPGARFANPQMRHLLARAAARRGPRRSQPRTGPPQLMAAPRPVSQVLRVAATVPPSSYAASRVSRSTGPVMRSGAATSRHCRPVVTASTDRWAPVVSLFPWTQ